MKTKIAWFVVGIVVSWATWTTANYVRLRPRDHTRNWPAVLRDMAEEVDVLQWLRHSNGVRVGNYWVFSPADSSNASAYLQIPGADGLLGIVIEDKNSDGTLDSILVSDAANRSFSFADENEDGVFDSYDYTTGLELDSKSFRDDDMDGQFDLRVGPGRAMAVAINSQWRELIHKDNEHYFELDGALRQVEFYPVVRILEGD